MQAAQAQVLSTLPSMDEVPAGFPAGQKVIPRLNAVVYLSSAEGVAISYQGQNADRALRSDDVL